MGSGRTTLVRITPQTKLHTVQLLVSRLLAKSRSYLCTCLRGTCFGDGGEWSFPPIGGSALMAVVLLNPASVIHSTKRISRIRVRVRGQLGLEGGGDDPNLKAAINRASLRFRETNLTPGSFLHQLYNMIWLYIQISLLVIICFFF